ncbi:DEAD/DEAH box helicase family protein [Corynebacterium hindlerae]|uniref:DEAD/DEAH box helicase n=1 Tax=Corynebacterium hindlerae TaxID=699041 RepID=UPI001AD6D6D6|nr:DEAD/DEAH box helicase family protein [Corynebacterium hindlerae]QTH60508.1 DEAD/DEAH box helicase family protein [Corynebacterium hindlerae]
MAVPGLTFDEALLTEIAVSFQLRASNIQALTALVQRLSGDFDRSKPQVMNMATGAGKTYVMAAFIEYMRRQGLRNVMIVTPGLVVQTKTVANFTQGAPKFIDGSPVPPRVVTPENYKSNPADQTAFTEQGASNVYVFNVQQLIAPKDMDGDTTSGGKTAQARGIRKFSEYAGVLYDELKNMDDLVILADEHHLYSAKAKAFHAAIHDLEPAALVGLTASPGEKDEIIFTYPLYKAIADKNVKQPVIVYRKDGYDELGEYQQLKDAKTLLETKAKHYAVKNQEEGTSPISPVMLVVCEDIAHATRIEETLVGPDLFGDPYAVLRVDSDSMNEEKASLLDAIDTPDSPVRAVVSVNKLKEGWDCRSIAVLVTLRAMDSDILTQQTLGRGLRLPYGKYTEVEAIDTLDIVAHESFQRLLSSEKVNKSFGFEGRKNSEPVPPQPVVPIVVTPPNLDPAPTPDPGPAPGGTVTDPALVFPPTDLQPVPPAPETDTRPQVGLKELYGGGAQPEDLYPEPTPLAVVELVEKFRDVSFLFPRTTYTAKNAAYPLEKLMQDEIIQVARQITDNPHAVLERLALTGDEAQGRVMAKRLTQGIIDAIALDEETVKKQLAGAILTHRRVERSPQNMSQAKNRIAPLVYNNALATTWTVDTLHVASILLGKAIDASVRQFLANLEPDVTLIPLTMPTRTRFELGVGKTIEPRPGEFDKYINGQFYSGWTRNLYTAASFDSNSAEHKLACDLDVSPDVEWWTRLYMADGASIDYQVGKTYYPDFVVRDREGRTWIVEGKDAGGRTNEEVKAKRDAAELALNLMASNEDMGALKVGYIIAYEDTIKEAGSWSRLISMSGAVKSAN